MIGMRLPSPNRGSWRIVFQCSMGEGMGTHRAIRPMFQHEYGRRESLPPAVNRVHRTFTYAA